MKKLFIIVLMALSLVSCKTGTVTENVSFVLTAKMVNDQYQNARSIAIAGMPATTETTYMIEKVDRLYNMLNSLLRLDLSKDIAIDMLMLERTYIEARQAYIFFKKNIDISKIGQSDVAYLIRFERMSQILDMKIGAIYIAATASGKIQKIHEVIQTLTTYIQMYSLVKGRPIL